MESLAALIFFLAIPTALAAGMAYALANFASALSLRLRTVIAALVAGGLPMAVPIMALVETSGYDGDLLVPLTALIVAGLTLTLVIGFPAALLVGRRCEAAQPDPKAPG